jgi:hypothetical protein
MGFIKKLKEKKRNKKKPETLAETSQRLYGTTPKADPFFISKDGEELSQKDYYNMVGTNKYTETAKDKYIYENSTQLMNKKKRKLKIKK